MLKKLRKIPLDERLLIIFFFIVTLGIYIHNATRDVYSGDIGDLVTAATVFGVAHPSGYPLFTFLGFLFSHLPLAVPPVTKIAYLSVTVSFIGLMLFFLFAYRITKNTFLSLLITAILAFSHFYWLYAEVPEVFGLNNVFVIAILVLAILFYQTKKLAYLYLLGFVTGLSLTHHQTILFILPAALLLVLRHTKLLLSNVRIIPLGILFLFLGLLPYLYVPVAAHTNPIVNWDDATTLNRFVHLVLRKDYGFAPTLQGTTPLIIKLIVLKDYLKTLFDLYSYQIIFVAFLGVIQLFRKDKWLGATLLFGFMLSGPFFVFYAAPPIGTTQAFGIIERMYSFSSVLFLFFVPFGFLLIKELFDKYFPKKLYGTAVLSYFVIIPIFMLWYNFPKTDLSTTHIGNNLAEDILNTVPKNALLFSEGDTTTFNIWYTHYVLHERPDILLINPPGVGGTNILDNKITVYKKAHPKVRNSEVLYQTLTELKKSHQIYGTYEFTTRPPGTLLLPYGMVFKAVYPSEVPDETAYINDVEEKLHKLHIARTETLPLHDSNMITSEIPLIYSNALVRIGDFIMSYYKDFAKAQSYYRRALWIDDENPAAWAGLGLSQYRAYNDCSESITNLTHAINQYPVWKQYYLQLFILYKACHKDQKTINGLKELYKTRFNGNVEKEANAAQHT